MLLSVDDLVVQFKTHDGTVHAVNGVSFDLEEGETLGLVGESGCGKSVTNLAMMRLLPQPAGRIAGGRVLFDGVDLTTLPESEMRDLRGSEIAMIFQDPMTSLNPVLRIEEQMVETIQAHKRGRARPTPAPGPSSCSTMVGIAEPAPAPARLPPPVQWRDAPAGDDRDGPGPRAQAADRRRADHRPGRHDPGPDARAAPAADPGDRDRGDPDHPRSGRRGRHDPPDQRDVRRDSSSRPRPRSTCSPMPRHPYTVGLLHSIPRLDAPVDEALIPIEGVAARPAHRPGRLRRSRRAAPGAWIDAGLRSRRSIRSSPARRWRRPAPGQPTGSPAGIRSRPKRPWPGRPSGPGSVRPHRRPGSSWRSSIPTEFRTCPASPTSWAAWTTARLAPRPSSRRPRARSDEPAGRRAGRSGRAGRIGPARRIGPAARGVRPEDLLPDHRRHPARAPCRRRPSGRRGHDSICRAGQTLGLVGESGCGKTHHRDGRSCACTSPRPAGSSSTARTSTTLEGDGLRAPAAPDADDLPGPLRQPEPADDGRRDRRRAARHPLDRDPRRATRAGRASCSTTVGLDPSLRRALSRTSSAAASASGSAWPERWPSIPT